jgi:hypothetical protein
VQLPITPFVSSEHFEKEVERIQEKRNMSKEEKKDKK